MRSFAMLALLALSMTAFGSPGTAQGVTFGGASGTTPYENLFGWHVGDVVVRWDFVCVNCICAFTGAPTVSETLPIQDCTLIGYSSSPFACGATAECPGGVLGQKVVLVIQCCAKLDPIGLSCVSHQETLYACP